jgi:hypothetical protein
MSKFILIFPTFNLCSLGSWSTQEDFGGKEKVVDRDDSVVVDDHRAPFVRDVVQVDHLVIVEGPTVPVPETRHFLGSVKPF